MTTKHTPGPWRYEPGRDNRPPYVIRGSEGGFVVVGMTAERQEADAALIACAPELLEALEIMLVGACAVGVPHAGERKVLQDAVDHARATINKARGAQ